MAAVLNSDSTKSPIKEGLHKLKEFVVRINNIIAGINSSLASIKRETGAPYESFRKHLHLWTFEYSCHSIALLSRIRGAGMSINTRIQRVREFILKRELSFAADEIDLMIADLVGVNIHVLKVENDVTLFVEFLMHDLVQLSEDSIQTKSCLKNAKATIENRTSTIEGTTTQERHLEISKMCVSKLESIQAICLELSFSVAFLRSAASAFVSLIRKFAEMVTAESDSLASIPVSADEATTLGHLDKASIIWGDITTVTDLAMTAYNKHLAASWNKHNTRSY